MTEFPSVQFAALDPLPTADTLIYFLAEGDALPQPLKNVDAAMQGGLERALKAADFKRKRKGTVEILAPAGLKADRLLIVGLGEAGTLRARDWLELGGAVRGKLTGKGIHACAIFDGLSQMSEGSIAQFALGFGLRGYSFRKYKSKHAASSEAAEDAAASEKDPPRLTIASGYGADLEALFKVARAAGDGVFFTRDLVNEPANVLTPKEFVRRLQRLEAEGLKVEVLDEDALKGLGMNAVLAVGQGSSEPTYAVVLRWEGAPAKTHEGNLVFVGKGVCFDTGGISIKPSQGMEDMKGDMAGAAAAAGALLALAKRKAPVNAAAIVGLVENMPSGTATRPGDIITSASGQTIEILNTDAEGRLVLADLLWYAQKNLNPKLMITLATLTGAIMVALGRENAGLFANNDELAAHLTEAGLDTGETVWRLPLSKRYDKMIDSKNADMKNIGGRDAGSVTAAQFLLRFVEKQTPWAHIDIAGTAMASPTSDINYSWASGFGVRLLDRLSGKMYE